MKKIIMLLIFLVILSVLASCNNAISDISDNPNSTKVSNVMNIELLINNFESATQKMEPVEQYYKGEFWEIDALGNLFKQKFGDNFEQAFYKSIDINVSDIEMVSDHEAKVKSIVSYYDLKTSFTDFMSEYRGEIGETEEEVLQDFYNFLTDNESKEANFAEMPVVFACVKEADNSWKIDFDKTKEYTEIYITQN